MHCDGGGLYLQVTRAGVPSWVFRFRSAGRQGDRYHGLGPLHTVSLAEARQKALECRKLVLDDIDPIEARRAKRAALRLDAAKVMSFKACAEAYIRAHEAGWRNPKHAAQWPATLGTYAHPVFGDLPVGQVDTALVMKALEPIWNEKTETASRLRGRIEAVLGWATTSGYRSGDNPARWRGHLENLLAKKSKVAPVEHHAALSYAELPDFMTEMHQQEGIAAQALQFTILTAARTGEVIGATWPEIDFKQCLWTIAAERMKAGREHRVPLSEPALAILQAMNAVRSGKYVFPGNRSDRPLSNMAMAMLVRRMGRADLTVHGFRSTFSDWCAERTAFPAEVREMALAHVVGDKVEAAYRRGDLLKKRFQLAEAWARFCAAPPATGEVVPMRDARK
jgi:integrase